MHALIFDVFFNPYINIQNSNLNKNLEYYSIVAQTNCPFSFCVPFFTIFGLFPLQ